MNYYDARQRQDGRYDYTSANRRSGTHAVGYCAETSGCPRRTIETGYGPCPDDCPVCGGASRIPNPDYCGSHDTPEEARECFRRFLLSDIRDEAYGDWTGCEVCDAPTRKGLTPTHPLGKGYPLCDEHRTREQLEQLHGPVGQITASY